MLERWINILQGSRRWAIPLLLILWAAGFAWIHFDTRPLPKVRVDGARDSEAAQVQRALQSYFGRRQDNALALVLDREAPPELLNQLSAFPRLANIEKITPPTQRSYRLYLLQMDTSMPVYEAEMQVPLLRQKLQPWRAKGLKSWLSGKPAFFYDTTQASKRETARSERLGLLLACLVLISCFGSLVAAALPLVAGFSTLLLTQVLIRVLGLGSDQTSMILDSMVGLGLSIDYCLFMVSRYREERQQHQPERALTQVMRYTGRTVLYSTAIMLSALLILLIPDVEALRDTVISLLLVVALAAATALLMLPWLLLSLDRVLDRPRWLARRILALHSEARWRRLATAVTARPLLYGLTALLCLGTLAWPAGSLKLWEPMQSLAPEQSESVQGFETLMRNGWGGEILPIQLLISAPKGIEMLSETQLRQLYDLAKGLQELPEVASVQGLVSPHQPFEHWLSLYRQLQVLQSTGLSPDLFLLKSTPTGEITLLNVHQKNLMDIESGYRIFAWLKDYQAAHPELQLATGGVLARARSFTHEMYRHLPLMLCLILLVILGLLSFYLKSWILPIKAGIMNFVPIVSAFGIMVWAFQWGGFGSIRPGITNIVPMTLFCIVFGLSMDYEVLILSRIDEAWRQSADLRQAVIRGLSQSSGMITGAALILLGVFAPGIASSSQVVRELSLGISATIFLDATLVRLLLVPALMMLMGKWNWWHPLHTKPRQKS